MKGNRRVAQTRRMDTIFRLFEQGMSSADINATLDEGRRRGAESRARGDESERNVKRALDALYYVTSCWINNHNGNHDYLSHDLSVLLDRMACIQFLSSGLAIPNAQVFVQVVSSQKGLDYFKKETMERLDGGEEVYREYLENEKLVVLNGQLPDEQIQAFFRDQLIDLNLAWAMR